MDDFEGPSAPSPWKFQNGPEFPGAKGNLSVTQGPGGSGHAGRLEGNFSGGGAYVAAELTLPHPVTAPLLAFRARASVGTRIVVRLIDQTGQTFQYPLRRPITAQDPEAWYAQTVVAALPSASWGGPADKVPRPPFTGLAILIEPVRFRAETPFFDPHHLEFDDVRFLEARGEAFDPGAAPLAFAGTPTLAGLGVNIHFNRRDAALDKLKGSGMHWLRMDLGWSDIEKAKGVYDFSGQDALVASAAARGLQVHFILDYGNPLYGSGPPVGETAVAAFGAFARAAAEHLKGKAERFEVWNEPNGGTFWAPIDAQAYAAACARAIAGVHAGNPAAQVCTGGVSEIDFPFVAKALAAGAGTGADAVGVHPYRGDIPEANVDQLAMLRAVVHQAYAGANAVPPLWDTEWGYTSADFGNGRSAAAQALHGRYTLRRILSSWAAGFPFIIQYDLLDDGDDATEREHNFGLLNTDLSDKPAMTALRNLTARTQGFTAKGFLASRESDMNALKLEGASEVLLILWRTSPGEFGVAQARDTVAAAFGARPAAAWDYLGKPIALPSEIGGKTAMTIGPDPIYVVFPKTNLAAKSLAPRGAARGASLFWGAGHEALGSRIWAAWPGGRDGNGARDVTGRIP